MAKAHVKVLGDCHIAQIWYSPLEEMPDFSDEEGVAKWHIMPLEKIRYESFLIPDTAKVGDVLFVRSETICGDTDWDPQLRIDLLKVEVLFIP